MASGQRVYLDESGDAGFRVARGSTAFFVVAATVFENAQDAEEASLAIAAYRTKLQKGQDLRFHFTHTRHEWRVGFLEAVRDCPFRVRAIVVEKSRIDSGSMLRRSPERLYSFTSGCF